MNSHPTFKHPSQYFFYKNTTILNIPNFVTIIGMGFIQISNVHESFGKYIHKKFHYKSYDKCMKCHMTLKNNVYCSSITFQ